MIINKSNQKEKFILDNFRLCLQRNSHEFDSSYILKISTYSFSYKAIWDLILNINNLCFLNRARLKRVHLFVDSSCYLAQSKQNNLKLVEEISKKLKESKQPLNIELIEVYTSTQKSRYFHVKAYCLHEENEKNWSLIVGSANASISGLQNGNTELLYLATKTSAFYKFQAFFAEENREFKRIERLQIRNNSYEYELNDSVYEKIKRMFYFNHYKALELLKLKHPKYATALLEFFDLSGFAGEDNTEILELFDLSDLAEEDNVQTIQNKLDNLEFKVKLLQLGCFIGSNWSDLHSINKIIYTEIYRYNKEPDSDDLQIPPYFDVDNNGKQLLEIKFPSKTKKRHINSSQNPHLFSDESDKILRLSDSILRLTSKKKDNRETFAIPTCLGRWIPKRLISMSDPVDAQNTFQKTIDDILKHLKDSKKDLIKIVDECYTELQDKSYPITTSPEKKVEEIINKFENLQNTNDYEIKRTIEVFSTFELPYDLEEEERIEEVYQSLIDSCNHYCRGEKQTKSKKDELCECILEANKNKNISILENYIISILENYIIFKKTD